MMSPVKCDVLLELTYMACITGREPFLSLQIIYFLLYSQCPTAAHFSQIILNLV